MPQTMEELVALIRQILDEQGKEKGVADAEADKGAAAEEKPVKDGEEEEAFAARVTREAEEAGQSGDAVEAAESVARAVEAAVEAVKTGAEGDASKEASSSMDAMAKAVKGLVAIVKAQDAKLKSIPVIDSASVIADIEKRDALYKRVTPFVGNFDANPMSKSVSGVAKYACDKLGLKPTKGQEIAALDGYLAGAEKVAATDSAAKKSTARVTDNEWSA